jgi:hypothetical protein
MEMASSEDIEISGIENTKIKNGWKKLRARDVRIADHYKRNTEGSKM